MDKPSSLFSPAVSDALRAAKVQVVYPGEFLAPDVKKQTLFDKKTFAEHIFRSFPNSH